MGSTNNLSVIVVGGGIGGLSAAIALRRAGHHVRIFEKSAFANEVGAAITLSSPATKIIQSWGLRTEAMQGVTGNAYSIQYASNLENVMPTMQMDYNSRYGANFVMAHRVDLHTALYDHATNQEGPGIPVELHNSRAVTAYDPQRGTVLFSDMIEETADLIVASDGVHSNATKFVLGRECPAQASTDSVVRFLISTEDILNDPVTAPIMDTGDGHAAFYGDPDKSRWLLRYPCRENKLQNFGMFLRKQPTEEELSNWSLKCDRNTLRQRMKGFDPALIALCDKTNDILPLWRCSDRQPLSKCFRDRLVIIGDALHPMLPHRGQGAVCSIQDAAALGVLFDSATPADLGGIVRRLEIFQAVRLPRTAAVQLYSRVNMFSDPVKEQSSECSKYLPEEAIPKNTAQLFDWLYGYDIVDDIKSAMTQEGLQISQK